MAISNFDGNTFVAFTDISGFKYMMKDQRAIKALDRFYSHSFDALFDNSQVEGFFVSDCGILISRAENNRDKLVNMLSVLERINRRLLQDGFMLTTSIAYGHFRYRQKIEFQGIEKNAIYGGAYVKAFMDNETGTPKLQAGQCRILKEGFPIDDLEFREIPCFDRMRESSKHFNFYWNVENGDQIDDFIRKYKDTYVLKFEGMIKALRG